MRALVDLYHQSSSFITKANLSARIDDAFIRRRQDNVLLMQPVERSMAHLEYDLRQRRDRPKFGEKATPTVHRANDQQVQEGQDWSERRSDRETAVFSTLYGMFTRAKPSYDTLQDERQRALGKEQERVEKDAPKTEGQ